MKNLITDKPAPITVKLAQTGAKSAKESSEKPKVELEAQLMTHRIAEYCNCKNKQAHSEAPKPDDDALAKAS